ncbi:TVP38/TMEM64 family protein [Paenibacillus sp. GYB003]|uniref:TVP38/TMEM64 family protein n=1 Tax=Paenibacillus sp. GYB003 TaxID=2994392 RepID=UPI002F9623DB
MNNRFYRLKYGIPLALFAAALYFVMFTKPGKELRHGDVERLADLLHSFGIFAVMAGMLAIFFQTWFPFIPFVLIAGANAYVFGLYGGFAINYGMSCAAAASAYFIARYVARDFVETKLAKYAAVQTFNRKLEKHGFMYTLLGRLIPVIPSSLINLGAGVSNIRFRPFFTATVIGKLPIVLLETLIGHDLIRFKEHKGRLMVVLLLFAALLWISHLVKRKWAAGRDDTDMT